MEVRVHPRIEAKRPEIRPADVLAAFDGSLRKRPRDTDPVQWVGVGLDGRGRLLEFVAVEETTEVWLVFHACVVTKSVLGELGLDGRTR